MLLPTKTIDILVNICKKYGLRGYSGLKKEGIINLILQNINNPQVSEYIRSLIRNNATTALILKKIVDNKYEISYSTLREEILQDRTSSTFRGYYRLLIENFILFEEDWSDDDLVYLPKEFTHFSKEVIEKHIQDEEAEIIEVSEEDEKEIKSISTLDELLYSKKYTSVEFLQEILKMLEMSYSGNKSQMIERLIYETEADTNNVLNILLSKNELSDMCRDFSLPVSGTKDILIERILNKFPLEKSKKKIIQKEKSELDLISDTVPKQTAIRMTSYKGKTIEDTYVKEEKEALMKLIKNTLNIIPLTVSKFKQNDSYNVKQRNLENSIMTALSSIKTIERDQFNGVKIEEMNNQSHPNIRVTREHDVIGISIWYFESNKTMIKIKSKIFDTKSNYPNNLLFYIYDPPEKFKLEDLQKLEDEAEVIYKRNKDFELTE